MRKLFQSLSVLSVLVLCAGASQSFAQSQAQPQENTFGGAIAPSPDSANTAREPEGYRGLIPGRVAPTPHPESVQHADQQAQDSASPQDQLPDRRTARRRMSTPDRGMSMRPGFSQPHRALTAEDLKQIAAMVGVEVNVDKIPPRMMDTMHIPPHVYPIISLPQPRRDGMLPSEFSAKQSIDYFNQQIRDAAKISPDAKRQAVDKAVAALSNYASVMRMQRDMPQEIYKNMGVPPLYVSESHEGASKAASRLEAELKALQGMQ